MHFPLYFQFPLWDTFLAPSGSVSAPKSEVIGIQQTNPDKYIVERWIRSINGKLETFQFPLWDTISYGNYNRWPAGALSIPFMGYLK